jgi:hypothetical protein
MYPAVGMKIVENDDTIWQLYWLDTGIIPGRVLSMYTLDLYAIVH